MRTSASSFNGSIFSASGFFSNNISYFINRTGSTFVTTEVENNLYNQIIYQITFNKQGSRLYLVADIITLVYNINSNSFVSIPISAFHIIIS